MEAASKKMGRPRVIPENVVAVVEMRAMLPPPSPIEHARRWPAEHRPHIKSRTAEPLAT